MTAQAGLRERLRKIEALVEGAGTAAERDAAEAALARLRARLAPEEAGGEPEELQFQIADDWSRHLFVALCRRNGLKPYRRATDERAIVSVRAPRNLMEGTLWRQFESVDAEMRAYLTEVTLKVIREEIHTDASDAEALHEALPAPPIELTLAVEAPPEPAPASEPQPPKPWFAFGNLIRFNRRLARAVSRAKH
jgi:uncharacterized protein (DUF2267 family)